jgi:integrase
MVAPEPSSNVPPLNPKSIPSLAPGEYRDGGDDGKRGLRLRVTPAGVRVFRWSCRVGGKQRWITIGRWSPSPRAGHVTLSKARDVCETLTAARDEGEEVLLAAIAKLRPAHAKPAPDAPRTVREAGERFLAHLDRERKRPDQARDMFDRDVYRVLGKLPLRVAEPKHVRQMVEEIVARGSPVAAKRTLALVQQFFRWCVTCDWLVASPADKFRDRGARKDLGVKESIPSRRVLSSEEIPLLWAAFGRLNPTIRDALRVLLLTGLRSQELRLAKWSEVDLTAGTLVIPPTNRKMTLDRERRELPWRVPLAPGVVTLLGGLKALADSMASPHVLASFANGGAPLSEKALVAAMAKLFKGKDALTLPGGAVSPHDLRRSLRFHARNTLGVSFDVSEKLLGHSVGKLAETYDPSGHAIEVGDLFDERRAALVAWDDYVARLVAGERAPVIPLRAKGARS